MGYVYIVILNYNGWDDTSRCLSSLLNLDYEDFKLVVVDNNSNDLSMNRLLSWAEGKLTPIYNKNDIELIESNKNEFLDYSFYGGLEDALNGGCQSNQTKGRSDSAKLTFIQSGKNDGFAAGNNIGIQFSIRQPDCDYIWCINNDLVVDKLSLTKLVDCYVSLEKVGIFPGLLGAKVMSYFNPSEIQSIGYVKNKLGRRVTANKNICSEEMCIEVNDFSGSSMFFSPSLVDKAGLIPEEYFLYYEETDWMHFVRENGFKNYTCLAAKVFHKEAASTGGVMSPFVVYYITRNRFIYNRKYSSRLKGWLNTASLACFLLLKAGYYSFKDKGLSKAILRAVVDGVQGKKGK